MHQQAITVTSKTSTSSNSSDSKKKSLDGITTYLKKFIDDLTAGYESKFEDIPKLNQLFTQEIESNHIDKELEEMPQLFADFITALWQLKKLVEITENPNFEDQIDLTQYAANIHYFLTNKPLSLIPAPITPLPGINLLLLPEDYKLDRITEDFLNGDIAIEKRKKNKLIAHYTPPHYFVEERIPSYLKTKTKTLTLKILNTPKSKNKKSSAKTTLEKHQNNLLEKKSLTPTKILYDPETYDPETNNKNSIPEFCFPQTGKKIKIINRQKNPLLVDAIADECGYTLPPDSLDFSRQLPSNPKLILSKDALLRVTQKFANTLKATQATRSSSMINFTNKTTVFLCGLEMIDDNKRKTSFLSSYNFYQMQQQLLKKTHYQYIIRRAQRQELTFTPVLAYHWLQSAKNPETFSYATLQNHLAHILLKKVELESVASLTLPSLCDLFILSCICKGINDWLDSHAELIHETIRVKITNYLRKIFAYYLHYYVTLPTPPNAELYPNFLFMLINDLRTFNLTELLILTKDFKSTNLRNFLEHCLCVSSKQLLMYEEKETKNNFWSRIFSYLPLANIKIKSLLTTEVLTTHISLLKEAKCSLQKIDNSMHQPLFSIQPKANNALKALLQYKCRDFLSNSSRNLSTFITMQEQGAMFIKTLCKFMENSVRDTDKKFELQVNINKMIQASKHYDPHSIKEYLITGHGDKAEHFIIANYFKDMLNSWLKSLPTKEESNSFLVRLTWIDQLPISSAIKQCCINSIINLKSLKNQHQEILDGFIFLTFKRDPDFPQMSWLNRLTMLYHHHLYNEDPSQNTENSIEELSLINIEKRQIQSIILECIQFLYKYFYLIPEENITQLFCIQKKIYCYHNCFKMQEDEYKNEVDYLVEFFRGWTPPIILTTTVKTAILKQQLNWLMSIDKKNLDWFSKGYIAYQILINSHYKSNIYGLEESINSHHLAQVFQDLFTDVNPAPENVAMLFTYTYFACERYKSIPLSPQHLNYQYETSPIPFSDLFTPKLTILPQLDWPIAWHAVHNTLIQKLRQLYTQLNIAEPYNNQLYVMGVINEIADLGCYLQQLMPYEQYTIEAWFFAVHSNQAIFYLKPNLAPPYQYFCIREWLQRHLAPILESKEDRRPNYFRTANFFKTAMTIFALQLSDNEPPESKLSLDSTFNFTTILHDVNLRLLCIRSLTQLAYFPHYHYEILTTLFFQQKGLYGYTTIPIKIIQDYLTPLTVEEFTDYESQVTEEKINSSLYNMVGQAKILRELVIKVFYSNKPRRFFELSNTCNTVNKNRLQLLIGLINFLNNIKQKYYIINNECKCFLTDLKQHCRESFVMPAGTETPPPTPLIYEQALCFYILLHLKLLEQDYLGSNQKITLQLNTTIHSLAIPTIKAMLGLNELFAKIDIPLPLSSVNPQHKIKLMKRLYSFYKIPTLLPRTQSDGDFSKKRALLTEVKSQQNKFYQ